jgi:hypothetical protein
MASREDARASHIVYWIPVADTLRGYIFEEYAMVLLEKGGTNTCRKLIFEEYAMVLLEKGGTYTCRKLLSGTESSKRRRLNPPTEASSIALLSEAIAAPSEPEEEIKFQRRHGK